MVVKYTWCDSVFTDVLNPILLSWPARYWASVLEGGVLSPHTVTFIPLSPDAATSCFALARSCPYGLRVESAPARIGGITPAASVPRATVGWPRYSDRVAPKLSSAS